MRIVGAVNVYQDEAFLGECLSALACVADRIVVVDGAYKDFPVYGDSASSTDRTLEIACQYSKVVILPPRKVGGFLPWPGEIEKRNEYLACGSSGEYFLVVDADEIVEGAVDRELLATHKDWGVDLYRAEEPKAHFPIHRLFAWRTGIRYRGTHHAVHIWDRLIHPEKPPLPVFPGLRLRHVQHRRTPERVERKGTYYRALCVGERAFRSEHGL